MRQWQAADSGMNGERGNLPERPDDPIAYRLLDVAGDALARDERQKAISILRLVVKDYRHSAEAACARRVIDRLTEHVGEQGR